MSLYNDIENKWIAGVNPHGTMRTASVAAIELAAREMRNRMLREAAVAVLSPILGPIWSAIVWLTKPLSNWWLRTQVYDELMGMDDRLLADIGISRMDIASIATGRYQQAAIPAPQMASEYFHRIRRPEILVAGNDFAESRVA